MKDPGTIYSDDEMENYSGDDNEEENEKEIALEKASTNNKKCDGFFDDLSEGPKTRTKKNKSAVSSITKYMKKTTTSYNINSTIEKVRSEDKKYYSDDDNNDENEDSKPTENSSIKALETGMLKLKSNIKLKEKKKERAATSFQEKMEKEKEELCFEDAPPVTSDITFLEMNLSPPLLKAIASMGYDIPTPIQASTIPLALRGRDICGCAATGTGKTAAFMLPIVQRLILKPSTESVTRVLVLVPTRELGVQVFEVTRDLCLFTDIVISLSVGGLSRTTQTKELLKNPDIIIATPGRLIDHLHNTPKFSLKNIEVLVLDEADRILDEFFIEQLTEIVKQCSFSRQTMLFSATMTDKVKDLVVLSLKNPVRVFVNNNTDVAQNLQQEFVRLKETDEIYKQAVLAHLLMNNFKEETIVFIQQKTDCHKMHIILGLLGIKCGELHGNLKQEKRLEYLKKFKDKEIQVLLATDVAARGLDIKGVKLVINYTLPNTYEMYVHRVGRTARAGYTGRSITLSLDFGNDYAMLRKIQKNSFAPLYERVIGKDHITFYITKLKKLEPSVKRVLRLEKEEKLINNTEKAVDKMKNRLSNAVVESDAIGNFRNRKRRRKEEVLSLEEINREKERLQKIISNAFPLEKPEKKKLGKPKVREKTNKKVSKNQKSINERNKKDKREREEKVEEDTKTSRFDKDLGMMKPKKRIKKQK